MRINILGSSGFIGKHLLNAFVESKGISLRFNNWKDEALDSDVIINLVGKAHDHKGSASENDYNYVNVELTKEIFTTFIQSNAKILIHISSLAALEEFESDRPLTEDVICNPQSWYGKSKHNAEKWLLNQEIHNNKKLIIIRPPMVHGPGDKGNLGLLFKFVQKGIPYPLSKFNNNRSFIFIDNFVFYIKRIIQGIDKLESGIYHVSDIESISTNQIINQIESVLKKKTIKLGLPTFIIKGIAKIGDYLPIPLNTNKLKKLTSNLLVSNSKINKALDIQKLPYSAIDGLKITLDSFSK